MITIWKYPIPNVEEFVLDLPFGAEIVKLDVQRGQPYIWVDVETDEAPYERKFYIIETGQKIPEDRYNRSIYVGTFMMEHDTLVLHLFEEMKE